MGSVKAEFLKLKRSLSWAVVVLLPVVAVLTGVFNTIASGKALEDGWHTLWLRVLVFYGLFPLAVGLGALSSLVWRVEHQGGNWNALMARPVSSFQVVAGKVTVLAVLAAAMQAVLLVTVIAIGKLVFGLPGMLPGQYFVVSAVIVLACLPVTALQSGLSMIMRSFAAPLAVALLGAVAGTLALMARLEALAMVLPYSLVSRAAHLGTGFLVDSGTVTLGVVTTVASAAVALTAVVIAGTSVVLDRRDIR